MECMVMKLRRFYVRIFTVKYFFKHEINSNQIWPCIYSIANITCIDDELHNIKQNGYINCWRSLCKTNQQQFDSIILLLA